MQLKNNGFTKAPNAIIRDPSLSPTAKVAWMLIASMKPGFHPTRGQWMEMLPCRDKGTWNRAVMELVRAGLVEVETVQGAKRYRVAAPGQEGGKTTPERAEIPPSQGRKNHPSIIIEEHIEEQKKNNSVARARLREEVAQDAMVEMGCMSISIDRDTYARLTAEIFNDWEFLDLPDDQWTKHHFLSVLRIKARELKRHGDNKTDNDPRAAERVRLAQGYAAAIARLAAEDDARAANIRQP